MTILVQRKANCHPDRKHCARGLCNACYGTARKSGWKKGCPPKSGQTSPNCHPDRKHRARGLCDSCYVTWLRANGRGLANPEKMRAYHRERHFRLKYGMSAHERDALVEQNDFECTICKVKDSRERPLHVDHCHDSGRVRGILCGRCNAAVGLLHNAPELCLRAAEYLRQFFGSA